jgi:hypothetical protein
MPSCPPRSGGTSNHRRRRIIFAQPSIPAPTHSAVSVAVRHSSHMGRPQNATNQSNSRKRSGHLPSHARHGAGHRPAHSFPSPRVRVAQTWASYTENPCSDGRRHRRLASCCLLLAAGRKWGHTRMRRGGAMRS